MTVVLKSIKPMQCLPPNAPLAPALEPPPLTTTRQPLNDDAWTKIHTFLPTNDFLKCRLLGRKILRLTHDVPLPIELKKIFAKSLLATCTATAILQRERLLSNLASFLSTQRVISLLEFPDNEELEDKKINRYFIADVLPYIYPLPQIQRLRLKNGELLADLVRLMPYIQTLDLTHGKNLDLQPLQDLALLTGINLSRTSIYGSELLNLRPSSILMALNLSFCPNLICIAAMSYFLNLTRLNLSHTPLRGAALEPLNLCKRLRYLDLSFCEQLTTLEALDLGELPQLQVLCLTGTPLNPREILALKNTYPVLKI